MMDTEPTQVKVLFVDDEENILTAMKRIFMDEEFEIMTANSGEAGLAVLREHGDVGLIVSDQRMPGMTGAEFLARSRELAPEALKIVLTGYADVTTAMDAINKGGACRYITKPWNDDDLIQTIRDAVNRFRLMEENRRLTAIVNKQNEELKEWNANLKQKIMERTAVIRTQNEELSEKGQKLTQTLQGMIEAFSRLVELCGARVQNHSRNVAELSVNIARDMGLSDQETETIRVAALLHDIGIIGISQNILIKSEGSLSSEEARVYRQHVIRGQAAIDAVQGLREVGVIIRHHHEHFNGKGYIDGLAGNDIPLGSRIIAVANSLDRAIGDQRGEQAVNKVLEWGEFQQGVMFDPLVFSHAKRFVRYRYFSIDREKPVGEEQEFSAESLSEGLLLTRNIYSGTGLLLLTKATELDHQMIKSLRRYYEIDPPETGIFAIIGKKK